MLGLFLLVWFIHEVQFVAMFFLLGVILFMGGNPIVTWAERKGLPRHFGTLALLVVALTLVVILFVLVAPPIAGQVQQLLTSLPAYETALRDWAWKELEPFPSLRAAFGPDNLGTPEAVRRLSSILTQVGRYTLTTFEGILILFIITVVVLYMLSNPRPLLRSYLLMFPEHLRLPPAPPPVHQPWSSAGSAPTSLSAPLTASRRVCS